MNNNVFLSDTNPKISAMLVSLYSEKSVAQRLSLTFALTKTAINLSKRAIQRANPQLSPQETNLLFAEYHYGKALADKIRNHLSHQ